MNRYFIWMRNYPQPDVNISNEWGILPFFTLEQVNTIIHNLETKYANPEWAGHPLYKAKFYAEEVK